MIAPGLCPECGEQTFPHKGQVICDCGWQWEPERTIKRRSFLFMLGGLAAVKVLAPLMPLAPEPALITIPARGGNMLLTPEMITREALRVLHSKMKFIKNIARPYDESFLKEGLKIRIPARYDV